MRQPAIENQYLSMWVIYDHPKDFPDHFVARQWMIPDHPTSQIRLSPTLEPLHHYFGVTLGMVWMPRQPEDDIVIVGTYF